MLAHMPSEKCIPKYSYLQCWYIWYFFLLFEFYSENGSLMDEAGCLNTDKLSFDANVALKEKKKSMKWYLKHNTQIYHQKMF